MTTNYAEAQQQYLEVPYEAMQTPTTYQIHSYDQQPYAMQPHTINFLPYNQYPAATPPTLLPPPTLPTTTPYNMYQLQHGYLQSQLALCEPAMYQTPNTQLAQTHQQTYDTTLGTGSNNNCHVSNVIPANKPLILTENPNGMNSQILNNGPTTGQMVSNANENICEIIKKGIVETVSG